MECNRKSNLRIALVWIKSKRGTLHKNSIARFFLSSWRLSLTNWFYFSCMFHAFQCITNSSTEAKPPDYFVRFVCVLQYFDWNSSMNQFKWRTRSSRFICCNGIFLLFRFVKFMLRLSNANLTETVSWSIKWMQIWSRIIKRNAFFASECRQQLANVLEVSFF